MDVTLLWCDDHWLALRFTFADLSPTTKLQQTASHLMHRLRGIWFAIQSVCVYTQQWVCTKGQYHTVETALHWLCGRLTEGKGSLGFQNVFSVNVKVLVLIAYVGHMIPTLDQYYSVFSSCYPNDRHKHKLFVPLIKPAQSCLLSQDCVDRSLWWCSKGGLSCRRNEFKKETQQTTDYRGKTPPAFFWQRCMHRSPQNLV